MFKNKYVIFVILSLSLLSICAVSAEDSSSLNINDANIVTQEPIVSVDDVSNLETNNQCANKVATSEFEDINVFEDTDSNVVSKHNMTLKEDAKLNDINNDGSANNVLQSGEKSFTDLENSINNLPDGGELKLVYDYKYTGSGDFSGINIDKNNIVINGNGHTIDANSNSHVKIFKITGNNVVIKNLIFKNANTDSQGAAIDNNGGENLAVINSTFINNHAVYPGGAINNAANGLTVRDSTFDSNSGSHGGAIYNKGDNFNVINSTFINNNANLIGGAISNTGSAFSVVGSNFIVNSADRGAAISTTSRDKASVKNSSFVDNNARITGIIGNTGDNSVDANDNWWGSNNPNWNTLFNGSAIHDSYAVLNLTINDGIAYVNFYRDGTTDIINVSPRDVELAIDSYSINTGKIVNGTFKTSYDVPYDTYNISATVDNQVVYLMVPKLDITVDNITYGDTLKINGKLPVDADGTITIKVGNNTYDNIKVENGNINFEIPDLNAGDYNVSVVYNGDGVYYTANFNTTVNVAKAKPTIDINNSSIEFGNTKALTVTLPNKATGDVTITINGRTNSAKVKDGKVTFNFADLTVGNYPFTISYSGDNNYFDGDVFDSFNVTPANANLDVAIKDINRGGDLVINVDLTGIKNAPLNGIVVVNIDGNSYGVSVNNGKGNSTIKNKLSSGNYNFTATWSSIYNSNYNNAEDTGNFNVLKTNSNIDVKANDIVFGQTETITVTLQNDATGKVILTIGNNKFEESIDYGEAIFNIPNLNANKYSFSVEYKGDKNYTGNTTSGNFNVNKANPKLDVTIGDVKYGNNVITITTKLTGVNNTSLDGDVLVNIKDIDSFIVNTGSVNRNIDLSKGVYNFTASWGGNSNYNPANVSGFFGVAEIVDYNMTIDLNDIYVGETANIKVSLPYEATGDVTLYINGKKYDDAAIKRGIATFNVNGLSAGKYNITAYYGGNGNYVAK